MTEVSDEMVGPGAFARAICESEGRNWLSLGENTREDVERWLAAGRACAATIAALEAERDEALLRIAYLDEEIVDAAVEHNKRATAAESALATANARVERLEKALAWYGSLPKDWTINAGAGATYGDLYMLGERARAALTGGENG